MRINKISRKEDNIRNFFLTDRHRLRYNDNYNQPFKSEIDLNQNLKFYQTTVISNVG